MLTVSEDQDDLTKMLRWGNTAGALSVAGRGTLGNLTQAQFSACLAATTASESERTQV